jgi:hypothetical protein
MPPIRVPKTPASAFDPGRPASSLLRSQVRQLQLAILDTIETEGDAAAHIKALTRQLQALHPHTAPSRHAVRVTRTNKRRKKSR